jgi:ribosomal protein L31E
MPSDNYVIPLTKAYDDKPRTKRANYSVRMIFDFLNKHTRKEKKDIIITEEVNNFIWKNSIQNPPRKVAVTLKKKDEKYYVFLKDSENSKKFSAEKEVKKGKDAVKKEKLEKEAGKDKKTEASKEKTDKSTKKVEKESVKDKIEKETSKENVEVKKTEIIKEEKLEPKDSIKNE